MKSRGITTAIRLHPLGIMNVCTNFHGNDNGKCHPKLAWLKTKRWPEDFLASGRNGDTTHSQTVQNLRMKTRLKKIKGSPLEQTEKSSLKSWRPSWATVLACAAVAEFSLYWMTNISKTSSIAVCPTTAYAKWHIHMYIQNIPVCKIQQKHKTQEPPMKASQGFKSSGYGKAALHW